MQQLSFVRNAKTLKGAASLCQLAVFTTHGRRDAYQPDKNICIDEGLCPWRGRSSFRVYMRDKPTKWGLKLYILSESQTDYSSILRSTAMCLE
ncbi:hypothetical protein RRG08_027566 [Elysia crispata]|uniref:PiggyBac transposable element-derived protein domain-containing protein n=1 Tax=Elysia crispata TaxID=231223 RepID=A0AAE1AEX7_9GAST|nr:hypothetical protein RRG08_027566 [Elysia crispata]